MNLFLLGDGRIKSALMMFSLPDDCEMVRLNTDLLAHCMPFSCGAQDLDEFLYKDSIAYEKDLMGKTYCWLLKKDDRKIVGFLAYYERNGFKPLFRRIEDEKLFYDIIDEDLKTRMYYFDLLLLK